MFFQSAREVFQQLDSLPHLDEFERKQLHIYKPSFTRQTLDFSKV